MVASPGNIEACQSHPLETKLIGKLFLVQPQVCWSLFLTFLEFTMRDSSNPDNLDVTPRVTCKTTLCSGN